VAEEELFPLVKTMKGSQFSRKLVTETSTAISERLGDDGYAFANVNAVPDINNDNKTVAISYFVDPGKRTYVNRINYAGNTKTRDEVLRREMRQMEGGWISTTKVNRSKVRLQRLGYFEEVNVETPAVPGATDQVDVNYSVTERPAGNLMLGLGFSQTQGLIFNTSVTQDNFLGSGKRVQFAFNNSDINRQYALGYTDPYFTDDGVSRGINLSYRETNAAQANITRFNSKSMNAGVNFGIPVTEFQNINLGAEFERAELLVNEFSSSKVRDFIDAQDGIDNDNLDATYNVVRLTGSFAYDTRNKALLPDRGTLHRVRAEVSVPIGDLNYYKVDYDAHWYYPLHEDYTLSLRGEVGYGDGYGDTTELPFFESFYAGGPRSVRGFRENTLGPKDDRDPRRAVGGNLKVIGNAELILPVPFVTDVKSIRLSAFIDAGNVYDTQNTVDDEFQFSTLRMSAGLSGIWLSPFGVLSVSVAQPFNKQPGDQDQPFQFTFGTNF
jgi:outer membrane protein insertion porin family